MDQLEKESKQMIDVMVRLFASVSNPAHIREVLEAYHRYLIDGAKDAMNASTRALTLMNKINAAYREDGEAEQDGN